MSTTDRRNKAHMFQIVRTLRPTHQKELLQENATVGFGLDDALVIHAVGVTMNKQRRNKNVLEVKEKGNNEDAAVALEEKVLLKEKEKDPKIIRGVHHHPEALHHQERKINLHAVSSREEHAGSVTLAISGILESVETSQTDPAKGETNALSFTIQLQRQQLPSLICNKARFFPTS